MTQFGNAERLVKRYGKDLRYCHEWKKWLMWNGMRWARDTESAVQQLAVKTIRFIDEEAKRATDTDIGHALWKFARRSETRYALEAMVGLAQGMLPVSPTELDHDTMLLNCLNGTVDLHTGKLNPHHREDLLTKLAPVRFQPDANCPVWMKFLDRIFDGDKELISFVQRAIGYALTGRVTEKAMFFFHGSGNNGKTTLLEVIRKMLGEYAGVIDIAALMSKAQTSENERATAELLGKRFVTSSEAGEGQAFDEARIKHLTGMGRLVGRRIYGSAFEFDPQFKLFIDANHKPSIRGTDDAIWNRMRLVPFSVAIPLEEQDKQLGAKLAEELPGILAWAVQGCLKWQAEGLGMPKAIMSATDGYREEMDLVADFLADTCIPQAEAVTPTSDLYNAFKGWCSNNNENPISVTAFGSDLTKKGFPAVRSSTARYRKGLAFRPPPGNAFQG